MYRAAQRHRDKTLTTQAGDLAPAIPNLRSGSFYPGLLERRRIDQALYVVIMEAYVHGVSTRSEPPVAPGRRAVGTTAALGGSATLQDWAGRGSHLFRDRYHHGSPRLGYVTIGAC